MVLDSFVGTGTTCTAAMNTARSSIGVEIDGEFVRLARERLQKSALSRSEPHLFDVRLNLDINDN
jgi:DNA modification methylase